jgi:hypothetical protein
MARDQHTNAEGDRTERHTTPAAPVGHAIARLADEGRLVRAPSRNLGDVPPPKPPRADGSPTLSELLHELRADRV